MPKVVSWVAVVPRGLVYGCWSLLALLAGLDFLSQGSGLSLGSHDVFWDVFSSVPQEVLLCLQSPALAEDQASEKSKAMQDGLGFQ